MVAKSGLRADAAAFVPQSKAALPGGKLGASVTANAGLQSAQQSAPGHGHVNTTDG